MGKIHNSIKTRTCKVCDKLKNINEFPIRVSGHYRYECKKCVSEWQRNHRKKNKIHIRYQEACRNYKISYEQSIELYSNTHCRICNKKFSDIGAIDHDHSNGNIRGVLCHNCNRALGYFKDDIKILKNAIKYLQNSRKELL